MQLFEIARRFGDMALLSQNGLRAFAVILDLALQPAGRRTSAKQLAEHLGLNARSLEHLLQILVRGGLLRSTRGPSGGYELVPDLMQVTLSDVLRAAELEYEDDHLESEIVDKIINPVLAVAEQSYRQALDEITINDMVRYAESKPVRTGRKVA
jgi:Rrf2 family transcriptional regulator, iron-sulfur cluster assembly transcription factor